VRVDARVDCASERDVRCDPIGVRAPSVSQQREEHLVSVKAARELRTVGCEIDAVAGAFLVDVDVRGVDRERVGRGCCGSRTTTQPPECGV
jgi:hypothetical protein